ncbi:MAG: protein kinase [Deltaproteobacteria bacterium]|nr:protein kinase [Deltaproteobacteria bacterium]
MERRDDLAMADTAHALGVASTAADTHDDSGRASPLDIDWSDARYERLETLGRGGMGEVELLRDKRIGRDVARKRMHRELESAAGGVAIVRFLREATVQGRLEHPSIVPVYDLERTGEGTTFTMKRIRGETLATVLGRGLVRDEARALGASGGSTGTSGGPRKWTLRAVLGAFVQVTRAVHFAHTHGVVHRDLKPANIMLGEFGEVYVLDWGLAKTRTEGTIDSASFGERLTAPPADPYAAISASSAPTPSSIEAATEAGSFLGTLGYTAPEQIIDAAGVDARADVYALGAILFEILAGEPLHPRVNPAQLLAATLTEVDVPARLGERAAPELVELVSRAVSIARDARPADAGAVADTIQSYLDGDRDLVLRRALAKEHRDRAATLATRSDKVTLNDRKRALAEVGRALALDPGDPASMRLLVSLLESPPNDVPDEVRSALSSRESVRRAALASRGALSWFAALAMVPAMVLMGVRSWAAVLGLSAIASAGAVHAMRASRTVESHIPPAAMLSGAVFIALFSSIFGPLWLGTMAALACLVPWLTVGAPSQRWQAIGFAASGVLAPLALEALGILPAQYTIEEGRFVIAPMLLDFAPYPTFVFLGLTCLLVFFIVAQFATSFRDEVDRSETSLRLLAWQLRQLAPEGEQGS